MINAYFAIQMPKKMHSAHQGNSQAAFVSHKICAKTMQHWRAFHTEFAFNCSTFTTSLFFISKVDQHCVWLQNTMLHFTTLGVDCALMRFVSKLTIQRFHCWLQ